MKKAYFVIVGALVVFLALGNGYTSAQTTFKDVNNHYWAKGQINYLAEKNIIGGYSDGTFKPDNKLTRAQAAQMLVKALKLPSTKRPAPKFKDITNRNPAYNAIATIANGGLMSGTNGYFRPNETLTRAQMASILTKAFKLTEGSSYKVYKDVSKNYWAYNNIQLITSNRISMGYPDGTFRPNKPTTRAQFSVFLAINLYPELFQPKDRDKVTREANGDYTYYGDWIYYNGKFEDKRGIFRKKIDGSQKEKLILEHSLDWFDRVYSFDIEDGKIFYHLHNNKIQNSSLYKMDLNGKNKKLIKLPKSTFDSFEVEGKWLYLETNYKIYRINLETNETTLLKDDLGFINYGGRDRIISPSYFVSEKGIYLPFVNEFYSNSSTKPEKVNLRDISSVNANENSGLRSRFYVDRGNIYYTILTTNPDTNVSTNNLIQYNESTKKMKLVKVDKKELPLVNINDGYAYFVWQSKIYKMPLTGGSLKYLADIPNNSIHRTCDNTYYKPGLFSIVGGEINIYKDATSYRCDDY